MSVLEISNWWYPLRNVILITIDALRKDLLGCYNNKRELTPFIDSIAAKSIICKNAQSVGPYTEASFRGILASSYYLEYGKEKKLSAKRTLISEVLKQSGITTAAFHSNPYLSAYFGWNRGWDFFYDFMEVEVGDEVPYVTGKEINRKVSEWLSAYSKHNPFFLWVHYMDVHEPYMPEERYIQIVDPSIKLGKTEMYRLFKDVVLKRDVSDKNKIELLRMLYAAKVREVDDYIRELFSIFEKLKVADDSVIIITSDHGDEFGEHGGLSHDGKMYSELIDIPLIIYNPTRTKGITWDALVSNIDIPPTIAYLFGIERVEGFRGHSLLPIELYPKKGCYGEAIAKIGPGEKETDKPIYYYREGNFKIIYRESDNRWEAYNLKEDPKELKNIIDSPTTSDINELNQKLKPMIRRWEKYK